MLKRRRNDEQEHQSDQRPAKRTRSIGRNHFSDLSDELVLRVLSFLSVPGLTVAERICRRFKRLASDNEIWREKFYIQFVRPRARRIPGVSTLSKDERENHALYYASKSARWLEHNTVTKARNELDWKRRYKVKLNWTQGRCQGREVALDCPYKPKILVKIFNGVIYTADEKKLRSYSQRTRPQLLNTHYWVDGKRPTAMTVGCHHNTVHLILGFSDGSFEMIDANENGSFSPILGGTLTKGSGVTSLATSWPYLLTVSDNNRMTLLQLSIGNDKSDEPTSSTLADLRSEAPLSPVSLSIRRTAGALIASIAYSFSRLNAGWCLGLQEIRMNFGGDVLGSRLTSTIDTPMQDFPLRKAALNSRSASTPPFALHPNIMNPPTSLSHSGCYILAGLPDNTLMVYTVTSSPEKLEISAGRRLFGHTSSVSGAEVSDRGKALSISAKGDEIRVWELEDLLSSWSLRRTSTQLRPRYGTNNLDSAFTQRGAGLGLALREIKEEMTWRRHWVGFDDEQVVVLGERDQRQILSCYDFA